MSTGSQAPFRVLFGVAAGPSIGFGHLVRVRSLARALGITPLVAIRGTAATHRGATAIGCRVVVASSDRDLLRLKPDVILIDDPSPVAVRRWLGRARRLGVPVASIHDLGIAVVESDLVIDGTIAPRRDVRGRFGTLHGPAYAILDPAIRALRARRTKKDTHRILIALGGGRAAAAAALARTIAASIAGVQIRVAAGFVTGRRRAAIEGVTWVEAKDGLAGELASASVAIVAGGVTLYEACALGVPAVAVAVNSRQQITIAGIARHGAVIDGGRLHAPATAGCCLRIAREAERLLADDPLRRCLATNGRDLVDGRGAFRVADRLRKLVATHQHDVPR